ncbi:hypothetical protein D9M68_986260 [compost metagenome]
MRHEIGCRPNVARRELARCEVCQGAGRSMGVFHLLDCAACDGTGLVDAATALALEPREMVAQLLLRLAEHEQPRRKIAGPESDYEGPSNRKGAGGSHYTGD